MADLPSFDELYAATHRGRTPFPWQARLARQVATDGWPTEIGVPTGLGKTACIDIAVWALACQAAERRPEERTAATRTWYVVNRRLLVDSAFEHGEALSRWLRDPSSLLRDWPDAGPDHVATLEAVAAALQRAAGLRSEHGPLHVARLRGGADLGVRPPEPSQPALVFATVPMFASRWLFRGYGSSTSMRPVDAALAGIDSLVLLDEAHLARPLARLAAPLAACDAGDPTCLLPPERARPHFVALTATGEAHGDRFDLDGDDLAHPEIRKRLHAAKPTTVRTTPKKKLAAALAGAAREVLAGSAAPTSCVVFANTPQTARAVFDLLGREVGGEAELHLLTGRMREREARTVRDAILAPDTGAPSDRPGMPRERHLVVVATQTLEVGADVDFEHLVTETAGVRAIVQRFGRLNRLGVHEHATATVVHTDDQADWPVYGTEPAEVIGRLLADTDPDRSLSPARIGTVLGEPLDAPAVAGELLPHHLWDWAKTSEGRRPLAEPTLFYEGADDGTAVSVIWRAYVPKPDPQPADGDADVPGRHGPTGRSTGVAHPRLVPGIAGDEALDVPYRELRELLQNRGVDLVTRLRPDGASVELVAPARIRPGDQIVLPTRGGKVGCYDRHGWAPEADEAVVDLSQLRAGLVLSEEAVGAVFDVPDDDVDAVKELLADLNRRADEGDDLAELQQVERERCRQLGQLVSEWSPPVGLLPGELGTWKAWRGRLVARLADDRDDPLGRLPDGTRYVPIPPEPATRRAAGIRSDAFDDLSFAADIASPGLPDHLQAAAEAARHVAAAVGLPADITGAVVTSAALHDLGKLDERFQRWLAPEADLTSERTPLAKGPAVPREVREAHRQAARWPRGGRHELLSARLLDEALGDDPYRDLLIHLVVSHHGHGRPSVGVAPDPLPGKVSWTVDGGVAVRWRVPAGTEVSVDGDLSIPDWQQPARFRRLCERYGYWGLALLEATVRQADHAVSAATQAGRPVPDPEVA